MKRLSKHLILWLCITTLLFGCASNVVIPDAKIPASLLVRCGQLEELQGLTGKDLLTNITNNAAIYHRCSDTHDALIEAAKPKNKK